MGKDDKELELLTDKELESFLSRNQMNDLMREIKKTPVPTAEENIALVKRYKELENGSKEKIRVQNELVEKNLRLVVSVASRFVRRAKSYNILDLVNEGTVGFITGLEKFDLECGVQLSTYVVYWIRQAINRALFTNDKTVRRPEHFEANMTKYRNLVEKYASSNKPLPSDDVLADILDVSIDTVKAMHQDYKFDTTSFDAKIDESDDTELKDFVGSTDEGYKGVLNRIVDREILMFLKSTLSPKCYYIIFHRIIADNTKTLQDIADIFNISRERVRQIEEATLRKLKRIFERKDIFAKKMAMIRADYNLEKGYVAPVSPNDIAFYFFIREHLTKEERTLYKLWMFRMENYPPEYYASRLGLSLDDYESVYESLANRIKSQMVYSEVFEEFEKKLLLEVKADIFSMDLDGPMPVFYKSTLERWSSVVLAKSINISRNFKVGDEKGEFAYKTRIGQEVNDFLALADDTVSLQTKMLIRRYFAFVLESPIPYSKAEKELNVVVNGYKNNSSLPKKTLYEALVQNKSSFTDEQYDYLLAFFFNKMKKKAFRNKYPDSKVSDIIYYLLEKLERLCLKPARITTYNFTKDKYLSLREKCLRKGLCDEVSILDSFFGVFSESKSIDEIAKEKGVEYTVAHNLVRQARERCLSCYLDRGRFKDVDIDLYLPYLLNSEYELNERGRQFALARFVEEKTYKEIGAPLGLKSNQVSNAVNDVLRQIDFYRFGIVSALNRYSPEIMNKVLKTDLFDDEEKEIVREVLKTGNNIAVANGRKKTYDDIKKIMKKFYNRCYSDSVSEVNVTVKMIVEEVLRHPSESILLENERIALAYLCGIKCDVNPNGEALISGDIRKRFGFSVEELHRYKKCGMDSIAARKCGLVRPALGFMERSKVAELFCDSCIPLTLRERELLSYYFELDGYPRKSAKELAVMYGFTEGSIKRRIQRAFVSLFKYELGEIEGIISYEVHVVPNLKFFSKSDQVILTDLYRDRLANAEIGRRCNLTRDQIEMRIFKLKIYLKDILKGKASTFDYDYFEEHVMEDDVPFYGDKELTYKIWWMFYEEKKSMPEIIEMLNLPFGDTAYFRDMDALMCAVLKRHLGIKKSKEFTYEEIRAFYLEHHNEMLRIHKEYYFRYFNRKSKWEYRHASRTTTDVSLEITIDMIKDRGEGYFALDSLSREEALKLMRKYRHDLSKDCFNALACKFRIQGKDFMSGSDQNKVIKALSYIEMHPKAMNVEKRNS